MPVRQEDGEDCVQVKTKITQLTPYHPQGSTTTQAYKNPNAKCFFRWNRSSIVETLQNLEKEINHSPSAREAGGRVYQACRRYFGTFNEAKRVSGLKITKRFYNPLPLQCRRLSSNVAYILGAVLGDGHVRTSYYLNKKGERKLRQGEITLEVKDKDFALEFAERIKKWSGYNPKIRFRRDRGFYAVLLSSMEAADFIKRIEHRNILNADISTKCEFLKGLYDSEGCVSGYNLSQRRCATRRITFSNSDKEIIETVNALLNSLGIKNTIHNRGVRSGFGGKKTCYEIAIEGLTNMRKFVELIGFSIGRKRKKLFEVLRSYGKT